eukprot:scaffold140310_cov19-Tisochrysis_lutea.AAC.5
MEAQLRLLFNGTAVATLNEAPGRCCCVTSLHQPPTKLSGVGRAARGPLKDRGKDSKSPHKTLLPCRLMRWQAVRRRCPQMRASFYQTKMLHPGGSAAISSEAHDLQLRWNLEHAATFPD